MDTKDLGILKIKDLQSQCFNYRVVVYDDNSISYTVTSIDNDEDIVLQEVLVGFDAEEILSNLLKVTKGLIKEDE